MYKVRKLIYIANARLPGEHAHSVQIMKMCEAFSQAGLEVELVLPFRFNKIKQSVWDYYNISPVFQITKLPSLDLLPFKRLGRLSFWVGSISFSLSALFYVLFSKADVIYSRDLLSIVWLSFFRPKKCVFEMHTRYSGWGRKFLKRLKAVITISSGLKNELLNNSVTESKILVASDGVDLKIFDSLDKKEKCRQELNIPLDALVLGYVGQLKTMGMEKGIGLLLSAFEKIRQHRKNLHLYLVGGWPFHVEEYAGRAGESVHFTGQVPYSLVPKYLASFDVLLMPFPKNPHYIHDMSPLKMFEYMAAKRPIVTSDLPSIREVLRDEEAFFFEAENESSFVESIELVLDNPDLALSKAAVAYVRVGEFSWEKRARRIIDFVFSI